MVFFVRAEPAWQVAIAPEQVVGGYGYSKEFPVEKYYRDAKLCTIGEGTSDLQKLIISREVLKN